MLAVLALSSCQKIDLAEENGNIQEEIQKISIFGTGQGSMNCPYTVEDILSDSIPLGNENIWVIGYVVGSTYRSLNAAEFSPNTNYTSNILISSDSLCTDVKKCIPVELASGEWKKKFSIPSVPQGFRKCVLLQGTPKLYFYKNGLRNICAGHWLFGFDISTVNNTPQDWEITVI